MIDITWYQIQSCVKLAKDHEKKKKRNVATNKYYEIQKNIPDIMYNYIAGSLYWLTSPFAQAFPKKNPLPTANDKKDKGFLSDDVQRYDLVGVGR